jgi:hypothetical protein
MIDPCDGDAVSATTGVAKINPRAPASRKQRPVRTIGVLRDVSDLHVPRVSY